MDYVKVFAVYIMGNHNRTLYTGVTNNLLRRLLEHTKAPKGFVKKYGLNQLFYYEWIEGGASDAIIREKQIKNLSRSQKLELIREQNPLFVDRSNEIFSLVDDVADYDYWGKPEVIPNIPNKSAQESGIELGGVIK